ncbi:LuxR family transcriptional regulator [uncultured Eubacterium sp.]|uniref:LuxR family transcriptional regulator n=1 Tax=uncultured Eubacterium sp. TaxID=165185 RepID=UPI0025F059EF|nr:LuxR family transcriptional regulator [uncultured Eubacterium sp.]
MSVATMTPNTKKLNGKNGKEYISAIMLMGIFTFIFLDCEYLFVNMISLSTVESKTVAAQNYSLGISALGFVLCPILLNHLGKIAKAATTAATAVLSVGLIIIICNHISYTATLISGMLLFTLLGGIGSTAIYKALLLIKNKKHLAKTVGVSYMTGTLLQFINNNLISSLWAQAVVLTVFLFILALLIIRMNSESFILPNEKPDESNNTDSKRIKDIGYVTICLIILVALITFIFSTLDNAVTLYHASGATDIGQSPRILLALSGLVAGFLFDIKERKYMSIIMYCVMILSTICLVIIQFSAPFLIGLTVFYLSAGFFAVFFTASFMEIAEYTKAPSLFAGLGRAVNNITAAAITGGSLSLLSSNNNILIIIVELILFTAISIVMLIYTVKRNEITAEPKQTKTQEDTKPNDEERLSIITDSYTLTPREAEVFKLLVTTDNDLQTIADEMYISKRTLERHISSIYKKTQAKSRIGLLTIFNNK